MKRLILAGAMAALAFSAPAFTFSNGTPSLDRSAEGPDAKNNVTVQWASATVTPDGTNATYNVSASVKAIDGQTFTAPVYCIVTDYDTENVLGYDATPIDMSLDATAPDSGMQDWDFSGMSSHGTAGGGEQIYCSLVYVDNTGSLVALSTVPIAKSGTTGVDGIAAETDARPQYYTLQGLPVTNPTAGTMCIVRQGNSVSKQLIR